VFGEVVGVDQTQIVAKGVFGEIRIPWSGTRGIQHRYRGPIAAPVAGWLSRIELQRLSEDLHESPDIVIAAVQSADEQELRAAHPWLGTLVLPWRSIRRIEPIFLGTYRLLDPAMHHLGNEVHSEFRIPVPEGNRLESIASFERTPAGNVYLSAEVDQMEASGSETPPGSPSLAELRAGFLQTEVFVNGTLVGNLNSRLRYRSSPHGPQRIRLSVPNGLLKTGPNTIRIQQRPARDDASDYDDCEIGRIALEIE
jgi:hypothetical protein